MSKRLHTILYYGNFEKFYDKFKKNPETKIYQRKDGQEGKISAPSRKVNGLIFGYMEKPKKIFVAIFVTDKNKKIILKTPINIDTDRHTDGKGFFADPCFCDNSAKRLLLDMIMENPEQMNKLFKIYKDFFRYKKS